MMENYAEQRARAARWIYERKDQVAWWRWFVLTDRNEDTAGLKLPPKTAMLIFSDLVRGGLLVPVIAEDRGEGFTIHDGKDAEWRQAMHPNWHAFKQGGSKLMDYLVGGVIGAVLGVVATVVAQQLLGVG